MKDSNFRNGDAKTAIFGSEVMLTPSPVDKIPDGPTTPEIAYQMVKDETFAQTQPRLNLATFVTTYMENRSLGYRFFRGLYARWCSRLVTLAQKETSTR